MGERIPQTSSSTEVRQAFQRLERKTRNVDISDDTNLAVSSPIVLTDDTLSLDQAAVDHDSLLNTHNLTTDIDHGSISGLAGDDHTIYSLVDGTRPFTGVVGGTGFVKTGWPLSPGVTLSYDDGTETLTVTDGGSAYYYINGVKYILGGNKTVTTDGTEGMWYFYFSGATLTASQTPWTITDDDKALVAYGYWDAANSKLLFLGYETHGYVMDAATHSRMHHAGGTQWDSGLEVSDAGSEDIDVSVGDFHDEDLETTVVDGAGAGQFEQVLTPAEIPILYRDGASNWRIYDVADKGTATDPGYVDGSNDLHYNKLNGTWASTAASGVGKYIAYWIIAVNAQDTPVMAIMGQREDNTRANAEENNVFAGLSMGTLPYEEFIVLARVILKSAAGSPYYTIDSILDLRATNSTGTVISPVVADHGGLIGLADDDHTQYLLAAGTRTLTGNMAVDALITIDGRDLSVDGTKLDGIEALADVTDATNVAAAGAAMSGGAFHDGFSDYVADKHVAHAGVSISSGTGLTGGGTIAATRTLALSHLGIEGLSSPGADRILFWDNSETATKWLQVTGTGVGMSGTTLAVNAGYVDRGDPTGWDWTETSFTFDGTWRNLDMSSIVPAGAYAVHVKMRCRDTAVVNRSFFLRKNGNSNIFSTIQITNQVVDVWFPLDGIVACSSGRVVEYFANAPGPDEVDVMVKGWFI